MILFWGIVYIIDGTYSIFTKHNRHYPFCPLYIEGGRIFRIFGGIFLIAIALILRFGYGIAWAKTIQPGKGLNQAKMAYQAPESFQGHLLSTSGIKTNRGLPLAGKASWYAKNDPTDPFEHKYNADGSRFDENAFTCAMRSRAFGRYYRVTNLQNNRSVIVKHADYNPFRRYKGRDISDRVIDLTKAAFAQIADLEEGLIKVKVEACPKK